MAIIVTNYYYYDFTIVFIFHKRLQKSHTMTAESILFLCRWEIRWFYEWFICARNAEVVMR